VQLLDVTRSLQRSRPDGVPAPDAPGYRRFMPALMPTRTESVVFFDQQLRVAAAERFVAETRRQHPELHATLFHVVLWALARMIEGHPHLNRFVAGGRLYERDAVWISFTVKSEMSEAGTLLEVKHRFEPGQPFPELVAELQAAVDTARRGARGLADRELDVFLHLPPPLRRGVVRAASLANRWNLLPKRFIESDPFFASAFVTNLGSVGLDAAFHHLYEYGTIPIFGALGAVTDSVVVDGGQPVVARTASMKFTYDERVEDGLYAARAIEDFRRIVEHPDES
jgi:hypothetical protein